MSDDDLWHPRPVPPSGEQVPGPSTEPTVPPSSSSSPTPPPYVPPFTPPPPPTAPYATPQATGPAAPAYPAFPAFPGASPYGAAGPYAPTGAVGYAQPHGSASTAMTLGIISLVCAVLAPFCWIPLLGTFTGPFAIVQALRAKREMAAAPGRYNNEGQATAGLVTGIIGIALGVLEIIGVVVVVIILVNDPNS